MTYQRALGELEQILGEIDAPTRGHFNKRKIASHYTVGGASRTKSDGSSEKEISLYVFNFENEEGFALISGDSLTVPVFAITESGSLVPGQVIDNPGLGIFLSGLQQGYADGSLQENNEHSGTIIGGDDGPPVIDPNTPPDQVRVVRREIGEWYIAERIDGFLTAQWGQDNPWNRTCPNLYDLLDDTKKRAKVGCAAVAVGLIMHYNQHPVERRWDLMRCVRDKETFSEASPEAQAEINELLASLGSWGNLRMEYGIYESGSQNSRVTTAFRNHGYAYDSMRTYDRDIMINEIIEKKRPAFIRGCSKRERHLGIVWAHSGCHAWVIDGALKRSRDYVIYYSDGEVAKLIKSYYLLHNNWGWNGWSNGYFFNRSFDSGKPEEPDDKNKVYGNGEYIYDMKMLSGIKPKK